MKRLPPAKRNQLIVVIVVTVALISMVYFFLILPQNQQNRKLASDTSAEITKLEQIKRTIKQKADTETSLAEISVKLAQTEGDVATGDAYAWTYETIRRFKAAYHVDIPSISQPVAGEVDLLPHFPYKQIKVSVIGTAFYHDLGKFVSDFENNFPHMRVVNLGIDTSGQPGNEHLTFHVDLIALVKPNP